MFLRRKHNFFFHFSLYWFPSYFATAKTIVLKSAVENSHRYESEKKEVLKLFADTKSEAIILLAEGRRIIGALLLGPKIGGNIYGDYDYDVFRKLYSYLFVFVFCGSFCSSISINSSLFVLLFS